MRRLRGKPKGEAIRQLVLKEEIKFLCIQETKKGASILKFVVLYGVIEKLISF